MARSRDQVFQTACSRSSRWDVAVREHTRTCPKGSLRPHSTLGACAPLRPRFVPATSPPILSEAATRLAKDYARISSTPDGFNPLHQALESTHNKTPNYPPKDLPPINPPNIS